MVLAVIGAIMLTVALLILFLDVESVKRKEDMLDREIKEIEIRLRTVELLRVPDRH